MLVKLVQLLNTEEPSVVTLSGMVTLVKFVQLENTEEPIVVTLSGILMLVISAQFANALLPISWTGKSLCSRGITISESVQWPIPTTLYASPKEFNSYSNLFEPADSSFSLHPAKPSILTIAVITSKKGIHIFFILFIIRISKTV